MPPTLWGVSFVLRIRRILGSAKACVACHVLANGDAESGLSGGRIVRAAASISASTFAAASAGPELTITTPSPPMDATMLPPAPAIV